MKFLCVPCDTPMTLQSLGPPDGGSLSVVYSCPDCGYEMAMLTNPFETQLVQSLGVRIGPNAGQSSAGDTSARSGGQTAESNVTGSTGKCPFPAMVGAMEGGPRPNSGQALREESGSTSGQAGEPIPERWTSAAEARLANIPSFVRPMARTGIEKFAREKGSVEVDEKILDEARDFFGM
jgi:hypothetical protein